MQGQFLVTLTDTPRRQARVSVDHGDNCLTWTFDAVSLSESAWDELRAHGFSPAIPETVLKTECSEVRDFRDRIDTVISTLQGAVNRLERNQDRGGDSQDRDISFLNFADQTVKSEKESGQSPSRVAKYRVAISRLRQYLLSVGKDDILLRNLNTSVIDNFNLSLMADGLKDSTRAFYNRILAAIYNRGVRDGLTPDNTPFANVDTQHR